LNSYVASLESRVEKLERKIAYAKNRKASVAMHDADEPTEGPDRKDSLAVIRAAIHGKAARRREVADVNELVSDFGFLWVRSKVRSLGVNADTAPAVRSTLPLEISNQVLPI
jgi:hypothetical protein